MHPIAEIRLGTNPASTWVGEVRKQLSSGVSVIAGRQMIDGVQAIKLTWRISPALTLW
ncbi:MAG: hypothetical protein ACM3ML_25825 [Micromonosporaceae bacterium]